MEFKTAQIDFRPGQEPLQGQALTAAFAFSDHRRALDLSTDTYRASSQGFSWLGVKTEPFEGWLDTSLIEFSFPDEAYGDYAVHPREPITQDGEWLWFPVRPLVVTAYSDHD